MAILVSPSCDFQVKQKKEELEKKEKEREKVAVAVVVEDHDDDDDDEEEEVSSNAVAGIRVPQSDLSLSSFSVAPFDNRAPPRCTGHRRHRSLFDSFSQCFGDFGNPEYDTESAPIRRNPQDSTWLLSMPNYNNNNNNNNSSDDCDNNVTGNGKHDNNTTITLKRSLSQQDKDVGGDRCNGVYCRPSRWKQAMRKLRAKARQIDCSRPCPPPLHYDSLSYAKNFDESSWMREDPHASASFMSQFDCPLPDTAQA